MTEFFANINGQRVVSGSITIPLYGLWTGDLALAGDAPIADRITFTFGNLVLAGAVYRQAAFAGTRSLRLVAGAGGWRKEVKRLPYSQLGGLSISTVLKDAAAEVGERVNVVTDSALRQRFIREAGPASRVLRQLVGLNWHIDAGGVTQIQAWPTARITSPFQVTKQDGGRGIIEVATEDYASWMPGRAFSSPNLAGQYKVGGAMFKFEESGKARLEVLSNAA